MRTLSCLILTLVACGDTNPQTTTETTTTQTTDTGKTDTGDDSTSGTGDPTTGTSAGGTSTSTDPVDPTSGGSTSTGATTGTSTGDGSSTTDVAGSSGTTDASSTTGAPAALTLALQDVQIYANCQPIIDADPLHGQWSVVFDNSLGDADMAKLVDVTFMIAEGDPPIAVFWEATPDMSGPLAAGAKLVQPVMKIKGDPYPACGACNKPFTLTTTYELGDGTQVFAEAGGNLECVY